MFLLASLLAGGALVYTIRHLGVNTDTSSLVSDELEWRDTYRAYERAFPDVGGGLVVLIDARTPELAEASARRLARELEKDTATFRSVYQPDGGPFFERHGLLFRDPDTLKAVAERVAASGEFLSDIDRDPGLGGLSTALERALRSRQGDAAGEAGDLSPVLGLLAASAFAASEGQCEPVPWGAFFDGRPPTARERRRILEIQPRLEFANRVPGREPMTRVREAAQRLGLNAQSGVSLRLTGTVAIEAEELETTLGAVRRAGVLAAASVAVILFIALRSVPLILVSLATLATGLAATSAFAALAIGHVNLISVAFAVLYLGLGIDYALHLCLRYRAHCALGREAGTAIDLAVAEVGPSLVLSALTTAACFYAFIPTDFIGVAELGLIGGTGMLISVAVTLTLIPAALSVLRVPDDPRTLPDGLPALARWVGRRRAAILVVSAVSAAVAITVLPRSSFDENPLNLRDPESESVKAYRDLLADPSTKPLTLSIVTPDATAAAAATGALELLPEVEAVRTVADFIPRDQAIKGAHLARLAAALPPSAPPSTPRQSALDGVDDLQALLTRARWVGSEEERIAARQAFHALRRWQQRIKRWDLAGRDRHAQALEAALVGALPALLDHARQAAESPRVSYETLPADLVRRWVGAAGEHRLEVVPAGTLADTEELRRFVDAVRTVEPDATGDAVTQIETGRVAVAAFRQALLAAGLITAIILISLLRSWTATALVLGPLALAAVWTGGLVVALGMPFNFANVIALPLLLGVGVDNGIHMVHQVRRRPTPSDPLDGSTGRAILFASLTTIASFGNLAFAAHVGMATMGRLLSVGMACVLVSTLVVLPTLFPRTEPQQASVMNQKTGQ